MTELNWDWPQIAVALVWRLAPDGVVITRKDLGGLPDDRVLLEDRDETSIRFQWATLAEAKKLRDTMAGAGPRAGVSQLQGRWQKLTCVLLWKLCKDKPVVLTLIDADRVPSDKILMARGHANDLEYLFVSRPEAARIQAWERDNEGRIILETFK